MALASVDLVIDLCRSTASDPAIDYELRQLADVQTAVEQQWPLPAEVKERISIGPFAAKNIADWNEGLANALMSLDYALQHDISDAEIRKPVTTGIDSVHSRTARTA